MKAGGAIVLLALLLSLLLLSQGVSFMTVTGSSMSPAITEADVIMVAPAGSLNVGDIVYSSRNKDGHHKGGAPAGSLNVGDIVSYSREVEGRNLTFTHRIISMDNGSIRTKGDALPVPDNYEIFPAQVMGVYKGKITGLGLLPRFARTKAGYLLLILIPASILILTELGKLLRRGK